MGDATGNRLPYAPDWTVNVGGDYLVDMPVGELAFNLTYYYNSGYRTTADNFLGQSHYNLVNARANWLLPDNRTSIELWGSNLTNALYAEQIRDENNPGGFQSQTFAAPRTYGVTVRYAF